MIVGITDRTLFEDQSVYLKWVDRCLRSDQVDYLIVREIGLGEETYEALIVEILRRNPLSKGKIIVHTHEQVALNQQIQRLHLPEALMYKEYPDELSLSCSIHPTSDAIDQRIVQYEFFLVSPVFATSCKPGGKPLDPSVLNLLKQKYVNKMVLLGGLDLDKIMALKQQGFEHFALRSELTLTENGLF